ncbi:hypothetical protein P280DRAFT_41112 [Massarina eburnea CBS 473.64]|uniref:Uncharacterized protein n=1 Tax=Massarina eburnea CBS 473.64 TaxID=1395130 RepID=A0A6A6RW49_9PLEO|nr:hypothetical protein P280DRAFT_41112 [Massarina eburnea CBS 473.64]
MLFNTALLGGLLLAGSALAKPYHSAHLRRSNDLEDVLRRDADVMATLTHRQDANGAAAAAPQTTPASGDAAKADLAQWEEQTKAACTQRLMTLNGQASNPSGIAVCYNLPFLDNQTGIFQAELRMYNISAPIAPWTGIQASDVSMTLSYLGATVQSMNGTFAKREISYPPIKERGVDGMLVERQSANMPIELKVLNYVGKINSNLMGTAMTQATLQPLLIPQIDLVAKNSAGQDQSTTLSSQEASFVNGVFAKQAATGITDAQAQASASAAVASVAPFKLPGTGIGEVGPQGVIITGVWMVAFTLVVGLGTFGRIQFREQYRRRVKNEMVRDVRTI